MDPDSEANAGTLDIDIVHNIEILKLPVELVVLILSFLPAQDIALFSSTSLLSHEIVNGSPELQYVQYLRRFKAVDNPNHHLSPSEKLDLLKRQRRAWLNCESDFRVKVPITFKEATIYDLSSGTYFLGEYGRKSVNYLDLPNEPGDQLEWQALKPPENSAETIIDFAANRYEHDMLCLVTGEIMMVGIEPKINLKLSIYELSTGQPHPFAKSPILNVMGPEDGLGLPAVYCEVSGDYIVLVTNFRRGMFAPCVNVFHWKTGRTLIRRVGSDMYEGVVFLDEHTILLPKVSDDVLEIWRIPLQGEPSPKHPTCELSLFDLVPGVVIQYLSCRGDPNPNTPDAQMKMKKPFYTHADDSVVLLHVWLRDELRVTLMTILVHRKALLKLKPLRRYIDGAPFPISWDDWAPSIVFCFSGGEMGARWITEACGQRFVFLDPDPSEEEDEDEEDPPRKLSTVVVLDFDEDSIRTVEREMEEDTEEQREHRKTYGPIVRRGPHAIPEDKHNLFMDEIVTHLPFVESRMKEKQNFDGAMLDQDRVIGVKMDDDSHYNSIEVLHIG